MGGYTQDSGHRDTMLQALCRMRIATSTIFLLFFDSASLPFKYKLWLLRRRRHSPRDFEVSDA